MTWRLFVGVKREEKRREKRRREKRRREKQVMFYFFLSLAISRCVSVRERRRNEKAAARLWMRLAREEKEGGTRMEETQRSEREKAVRQEACDCKRREQTAMAGGWGRDTQSEPSH